MAEFGSVVGTVVESIERQTSPYQYLASEQDSSQLAWQTGKEFFTKSWRKTTPPFWQTGERSSEPLLKRLNLLSSVTVVRRSCFQNKTAFKHDFSCVLQQGNAQLLQQGLIRVHRQL
jgi:hypothetical protein